MQTKPRCRRLLSIIIFIMLLLLLLLLCRLLLSIIVVVVDYSAFCQVQNLNQIFVTLTIQQPLPMWKSDFINRKI